MGRAWAGFFQPEKPGFFFGPARARPVPWNAQVYLLLCTPALIYRWCTALTCIFLPVSY
jgi:hypothetical protein